MESEMTACGSDGTGDDGAFDPVTLEKMAKLFGDDGMADLLDRFHVVVGELRAGLAPSASPEDLAASAHSTAGCAKYLGLTRLTDECRALELACLKGDGATATRLTAAVSGTLDAGLAWLAATPWGGPKT
jgi:HPt (histidine-containing phosphotransfer) domain-containing protein